LKSYYKQSEGHYKGKCGKQGEITKRTERVEVRTAALERTWC